MTKYLFLKFRQASHWISCDYLLTELELCYNKAFENISTIEIDLDESTFENSFQQISELEPDVIIFADHRFRIPFWIFSLNNKLSKKVSWSIHTYGCFTGRVDEWIQLTKLIPNEKIKFFSGSETHSRIIRNFFNNQHIVETFPFPFLEANTSFSSKRRQFFRQKYKLEESDLVFVYAGRISYQKNVHHLIRLFNELTLPDKQITLFIAGLPDDKNPRELPYGYYLNYAAELFQQELNTSKLQVNYLNQLSAIELNDLYQASDFCVSLSTLYGEDYGRSLIEGLSTGLGVIATSWGGHKDLACLPQVKLIDVCLENETLKLDLEQFKKYLTESKHQNREQNIDFFEEKFGHAPAGQKLKALYKTFANLGDISKDAVYFELKENNPWKGKEFFNLHEKILQPYWK